MTETAPQLKILDNIVKDAKITGPLLILDWATQTSQSSKPFIKGTAFDGKNRIPFKIWDNVTAFETMLGNCSALELINAKIDEYKEVKYLVIYVAKPYTEDVTNLLPSSPFPKLYLLAKFQTSIEAIMECLQEDSQKTAFMDDYKKFIKSPWWTAFINLPAAKGHHHAYIRGLITHAVEVLSICSDIIEFTKTYHPETKIDVATLLFAAAFHDIGKIEEYKISQFGLFEATAPKGLLLHHNIIGINILTTAFSSLWEVAPEMWTKVQHCLLAHHGRLDYGAMKEPLLTEAQILSCADNLSYMLSNNKELDNAIL